MLRFQELMRQFGRSRSVRVGDHLFRQGDRSEEVFLVRKGMLKAYYIRPDGREHIKSFLPEGSIIGSMVALLDGDACTFSLVAIEDGEVISLPYARIEQGARNDIELANALVDFLSIYGKRKERREFELLSLSPEDRYRIFEESMPEIAGRVSQADLAAYIGITPQALSRIKRRQSRSQSQ